MSNLTSGTGAPCWCEWSVGFMYGKDFKSG